MAFPSHGGAICVKPDVGVGGIDLQNARFEITATVAGTANLNDPRAVSSLSRGLAASRFSRGALAAS